MGELLKEAKWPEGRSACMMARHFIHGHRKRLDEVGELLVARTKSARSDEEHKEFMERCIQFHDLRTALRRLAYSEQLNREALEEGKIVLQWLAQDRSELVEAQQLQEQKQHTRIDNGHKFPPPSAMLKRHMRESDQLARMVDTLDALIQVTYIQPPQGPDSPGGGLHF